MIGTLARVLAGFLLACLAAGLVIVLFVITPAQLAAVPTDVLPDRGRETVTLALLTATHAAIFAAAFALIATGIGEWFAIRTLPYYLISGCAIALLGFLAQFSSEVSGQPTIFNNYALKAYVTAGFFAGLVYWLAAGQHAGGRDNSDDDDRPMAIASPSKPPRIVVEKSPQRPRADVEVKKPDVLTGPMAKAGDSAAAEVGTKTGPVKKA